VQHIELAPAIVAALIVFVEALEGVLDSCKIRDASVYGLQELDHRQVNAVKGGDVVEIKR
jgi:hypothetical protein